MSADETKGADGFAPLDDYSSFQMNFGQMYQKQKPRGAAIGLRVADAASQPPRRSAWRRSAPS